MPRLRSTEQQRREKALRRAIARARVDLDLPLDNDLCAYLNIPSSTFSRIKREPYRGFGFERAGHLARSLHFTGREVCEIIGVPYADPRENDERR